jgi:hypothetical protein
LARTLNRDGYQRIKLRIRKNTAGQRLEFQKKDLVSEEGFGFSKKNLESAMTQI